MKMPYNTGNAVGSVDPRDLIDNAENLDQAVNAEQDTFQDRLGKSRLTWAGMENQFDADQGEREVQFDADQAGRESEFNADQAERAAEFDADQSSREAVFSDFLQASGYQDLGEYAPGIEITAHNQYVTFGGQPYLLKPSIPVPYTTSGEWTGEDFKLIGDDVLRQDLANPDMGAAMVARGVVAVDSIADLLALTEGQRKEGLRYLVKGYHAGSALGGGEFYWSAHVDRATADGGFVLDPTSTGGFDGTYATVGNLLASQGAGSGEGCYVRRNSGPVSPMMFGFDESEHSNSEAVLRAMFSACRDSDLPVDFAGISQLRMPIPSQPVEIYTEVDFRGCVLKMIDAVFPPEDVDWGYPTAFTVPPQAAFIDVEPDHSTLTRGNTVFALSEGDPLPNGFYILRTERLLPPRHLNGAHIAPDKYSQAFAVYSGESTIPLALDVSDRIDNRFQYRPFCRPMSLKGLVIDTASFNNLRVLQVSRDNVTIESVTSSGDSSFNSINSVLNIQSCHNTEVSTFVCPQNYRKPGDGSYTISMSRVCDVLFDNITSAGSPETWGAFGCNYVGNVTIRDSKIGRFDSHSGMFGRTVIRDCRFSGNSIRYGWGAGSIKVSGSTFINVEAIVVQRNDYWGNFDGDITIDDCDIEITDNFITDDMTEKERLFYYGNIMQCPSVGRFVDPAYANSVMICRHLTIRDVRVRRPYFDDVLGSCNIIRSASETDPAYEPTVDVFFPQTVHVEGLRYDKTAGEVVFSLHVPGRFFKGIEGASAVLRDVDNSGYVRYYERQPAGSLVGTPCLFFSRDRTYSPGNPIFETVVIDNCKGVSFYTPEDSKYRVINSECAGARFVYSAQEDPSASRWNPDLKYSNCTFNTSIAGSATVDPAGALRIDSARYANCHFSAQLTYYNAKSAIGCTFDSDISIISTNAPLDKELWFTGFSEDAVPAEGSAGGTVE